MAESKISGNEKRVILKIGRKITSNKGKVYDKRRPLFPKGFIPLKWINIPFSKKVLIQEHFVREKSLFSEEGKRELIITLTKKGWAFYKINS